MFWFAQGKEFEKLEEHNLFDCIECGACSFACPSNIPLVQYYRASKAEILQLRHDHEVAEQSRIRFEARQQRLEQAEEEKEAKRAARKIAAQQRAQAAEEGGEEDPIQAAIERAKAKKASQQADTGDESELETLEKAVVSTHKRLGTAMAKLEQAKAEGSDLVGALQTGVEKTRDKLTAAEQALKDCQQRLGTHSAEQPPADAAQAAIARAMQARTTEASFSPQEKARLDLEKLQRRLRKSQAVLIQSRENAEEEKVIDALESTVARLTDKIKAAQQQLNAAEDA
jgi:electron transport complex protein RnfC